MKEVQPPEAYQLLQGDKDAILIDVRSTMEYDYVGHPVNALHVPIKEPPDWQTRTDFVSLLRQALRDEHGDAEPENRPLLMLCRSGKRSEMAATLLEQDGFTNVYNILEGFEGDKDESGHRNTLGGWRFHQLPWEQD